VSGRIRDEDLALVRERSAIEEVVGEYLQLRGAGGGSLKGLCPFHEEKTPSFNVTPARGLWYCFACNEGGDAIKFIEKIENLSFTEAVERLAARSGIELRYEQGGHVPGHEQSQRRRLLAAHQAASEFFSERLLGADADTARAFLSSRGFEAADAERFAIGYAPADWDVLTRHLRGRGYTDRELLAGGLASQGRRGLIDKFRGRLIWPIRDLSGEVIAFGARKLSDSDDGPKYLNTPETPLFHKSSVLYGADLAKREIAQRRQAVIVEGYTDVMACHLAGVGTAVATSGTAFGEGHIAILRRLLMDSSQFRGEVIFTFDGDAAGQRAALRAFDTEQKFVTQTFVTVQRDGLDPCDLRLKHGDAAVRELVAQRVPLYEFKVRSVIDRYDRETAEGRLAALDEAAPIVAGIKDRGLRKVYAVNLDRWLGLMDEELVLARISERGVASRRAGSRPRRDAVPPRAAQAGRPEGSAGEQAAAAEQQDPAAAYDAADPVVNLERQALKLAVQRPELCGAAFDGLGPDDFTVGVHVAVRELLAGCGGVAAAAGEGNAAAGGAAAARSPREWAEQLRDAAPNDAARAFLTRLAVEPLEVARADGEPDARYADAVLARVEELSVSRQIAAVKSRLQRLSPVAETASYNRMFGDLVALEERRKLILERAAGAL
jgi:DNA primase